MSYILELQKEFKALQGLKSPIRDAKEMPSLQPVDGYHLVLKVGISFDYNQLNDRGWFIDTDSIDNELDALCKHFSSKKWTELFEFRPTFELVTRWAYKQLHPKVKQLEYVTLVNQTLGITVEYKAG